MWTRSYSMVTKEVTKEQLWQLFADVNNWHTWDEGIEYAKLDGAFTAGNYFTLRPKDGPNVKIKILKAIENKNFTDLTVFPLAKMYGEHLLEETENGLTITSTITVKGILAFLWVKLVAQKITDGFATDMEAQIKAASKL
ncbi:SRPBCC family protein [Flavobacterium humi]|uniref:Polyketide cyclase n=1 Tax=Flavobacterium humi TaxID=2562683 RepID=A0A4Z0L6S5_9FLAO|nr:polyketide cyclase [Flavobacterium humi]TGD57951.1 polyketide cyclase [Flavobacterium humi]